MGTIRDVVLTLGILLALLVGLAAFPALVVIISGAAFIGFGYLIFAVIHDIRIHNEKMKEKANDQE